MDVLLSWHTSIPLQAYSAMLADVASAFIAHAARALQEVLPIDPVEPAPAPLTMQASVSLQELFQIEPWPSLCPLRLHALGALQESLRTMPNPLAPFDAQARNALQDPYQTLAVPANAPLLEHASLALHEPSRTVPDPP
jgi:hypothetical protein